MSLYLSSVVPTIKPIKVRLPQLKLNFARLFSAGRQGKGEKMYNALIIFEIILGLVVLCCVFIMKMLKPREFFSAFGISSKAEIGNIISVFCQIFNEEHNNEIQRQRRCGLYQWQLDVLDKGAITLRPILASSAEIAMKMEEERAFSVAYKKRCKYRLGAATRCGFKREIISVYRGWGW